ncbi:dihydrodipicolinate synthase family protein [Kordiimonas sp.]|uniref:dihydrodipicolinate synthase family protein n=1 Tax=Kordiimonas sp. TaxID=1970157 RepID=UPI003A959AEC
MIDWSGVFPATTTQFNKDESLDLDSTQRVIDGLIKDGVHGIIALGTVGENCSLSAKEKRSVLKAAVEVVDGRVPLLSGVAEFTPKAAAAYASDAETIGADGLMVLPAMVYQAQPREIISHYQTVASATDLPIMIYNNPVSYKIDIKIETMTELAKIENLVAVKESSEDTRRIIDLQNAFGDRFAIFGGVDDIALESLMLGAQGWVSGLTNAFPRESVAIYNLAKAGRYDEALEIYRWFMPLLDLDTIPTLVQCIKLVEEIMGRGSEVVRAPRMMLEGEERAYVHAVTQAAVDARPTLPADLTKAA